MDWDGLDGLDGLDLCAGLFYEHRFAMLIKTVSFVSEGPYGPRGVLSDFEGGGGGGSPRCIIGQTLMLLLEQRCDDDN